MEPCRSGMHKTQSLRSTLDAQKSWEGVFQQAAILLGVLKLLKGNLRVLLAYFNVLI